MEISAVNKTHTGNKVGTTTGAIIGAAGSSAYLLKNVEDAFVKSLPGKGAEKLVNTTQMRRVVGVTLGFFTAATALGSLVGKAVGAAVDHHHNKKVSAEE